MKENWVLITGGTSGIGLATALLFALEGYQVIATGRSENTLKRVDEAAEKAGVTLRYVLADVAEGESVAHLRNEVLALTNGYGVDVLINNAGYAEGGAIEEIPVERLKRQFDTNVIGLVTVTQAFLPFMRTRRYGKIVNISSVLGKVTIPLMGAYTASKHAVESISDALRMELGGTGIDVITVAPGSIQTNFGSRLVGSVRDWMQPTSPYRAAYEKFTSDRESDRGAQPVAIAQVILQAARAASPKPRYAAPFDSKLMPVLKSALPTRTLDRIVRSVVMGKPQSRTKL